MAVLNPWAIVLGGLAVGLPIAIHLLTRPRPVRLPLSTIRFVQEAVHQRRARHRLRDFLILALRALAVALIAAAFARPLLRERPLIADGPDARATRIVLLDVSQSMGARDRGIERIERARALASARLAHAGDMKANLILAAARAAPIFDQPSSNFAALREALGNAAALPQRLDVPAALRSASDMLAASPGAESDSRHELVIISDFQRANWTAADFSALPEDTLIQLESIAPPEPTANLAVLSVAAAGRAERGRECRIEVEVGNFTPALREVEVELSIGGSTLRLSGACPPNAKATLATDTVVRQAGWLSGEARLVNANDALPADDRRAFVLNVRPATTYALVTRQRADRKPSSAYFVERALAPYLPGEASVARRVLRVAPEQLDRETIGNADLIVLDHPGKLAEPAVALLASLMQRGRPLLYVAAEPLDATNLKLLSDAAGAALQLPVEFMPPPGGTLRQDLSLSEIKRRVSPFAVFGDELESLVRVLRFSGGLATRRLESGVGDDVLASYNDRSAFLVVSACGAGALAVMNADLYYSNLPGSPMFVPLVGELSESLLAGRGRSDAAASGEALVAYLPPEVAGLSGLRVGAAPLEAAVSPDADLGELYEERSGVLWRWNTAGPPGVYTVSREEPVYAVATAIPPEEADMRPLSREVLEKRLAGGRRVQYRAAGAEDERTDGSWTALAVACLACIGAELVVLRVFRT